MNITKKAVILLACVLLSTTLYSTTASAATYTIVSNDSLYKVSLLFKIPLNTLISDNDLSIRAA